MLRHSVSLHQVQTSGWVNPMQKANNEVLTSAVTFSADDSGRVTARQVSTHCMQHLWSYFQRFGSTFLCNRLHVILQSPLFSQRWKPLYLRWHFPHLSRRYASHVVRFCDFKGIAHFSFCNASQMNTSGPSKANCFSVHKKETTTKVGLDVWEFKHLYWIQSWCQKNLNTGKSFFHRIVSFLISLFTAHIHVMSFGRAVQRKM